MSEQNENAGSQTTEPAPPATRAEKRAQKRAAKPARKSKKSNEPKAGGGTGAAIGSGVAKARTQLARVVWAVCVLLASVLAAGALCIALDANRDNGLVIFLLDLADDVDLGVFSRENGIKEFGGDNAELKNALFNWGLGAVAWLVIGRVLDRVVRP